MEAQELEEVQLRSYLWNLLVKRHHQVLVAEQVVMEEEGQNSLSYLMQKQEVEEVVVQKQEEEEVVVQKVVQEL